MVILYVNMNEAWQVNDIIKVYMSLLHVIGVNKKSN